MERVVRVLHVGPVADPLGQAFELADEREHRFPTKPRELFNAHLLDDGLLSGDAQLSLDLDFDRQSVGIPTGAARHKTTLHCLITTEEILVDAGPHVMKSGLSIGGGWPLVED